MSKNDGGPAFPATEFNQNGGHYEGRYEIHAQHSGLSLRDYFAAKAMSGMLGSQAMVDQVNDNTVLWTSEAAYRFADAMLAAREACPST